MDGYISSGEELESADLETVASNSEQNRLSTGIDALDDHLNGGPRPGSLVSARTPPASQFGGLVYPLMRQRPTVYLTTVRVEEAVRDELEYVLGDEAEFVVESVGTANPIRSVNRALEQTDGVFDDLHNIVIDSINPLERTDKYNRYVDLLNGLKSHMLRTGGLVLLHCSEREQRLQLRELTLAVSDLVFDLDIVTEKNTVENRLTIPKYRGEDGVEEVIKLKLGRETEVDTSRNL